MTETTYRIPESVIEDTLAYRGEVEKFLSGDISPVAYRALRVPMGIYEQRENDTYMVRVRGAAGVFLADQVTRVADLAGRYGDGTVHVTTRQDLQIHRVLVQDTPDVLESLLGVGLSSRGGGGNTVRNVSACPHAGVCPDEAFDVTPYATVLTEYLLMNRANFNLPRKFKVAFSGCGKDCGLASVADLGFFAHIRDGVTGFSVYAAGGMGLHSQIGILIDDFIPAESVFETAEAVKRLFDRWGDRTNRNKARLRFVVERFGPVEFRRLYREELAQVQSEGIQVPSINPGESLVSPSSVVSEQAGDDSFQRWREKNVLSQKQSGLFTIAVALPLGDIRHDELRSIADLSVSLGDAVVRTTQEQGILLRNIPEGKLHDLYIALRNLSEQFVIVRSIRCVACAGASTCKLGLCLSRGLAQAIETELAGIDTTFDSPIRISGCPNCCGHHPISSIGLFGGASRVDGRLVPYYSIVAGARLSECDSKLAEFVAKVPARSIPALLKEFFTSGESLGYLGELAVKYASVPTYEEAPEFYRDFGSEVDFSLAGRGPGECGAGVMDVIALDLDQARNAIKEGKLYDAVLAAARALLVTKGIEPKKDREVFSAFEEHLIAPKWVSPRSQALVDAALDFKLGDRSSLDDLRSDIESLVDRVEELFRSLDSSLSFRIEPIGDVEDSTPTGEAAQEIDLRGVACPMNFARAKIQLEQAEIGEVLDVLLDDGEPVRNVPASFADQGQEVVSIIDEDGRFRVRIRRVV